MSTLKNPVTSADHTRGASNPQLQIVEYGDYQCPYCGMAEPWMEKISKEFGTVVSVTFRNFPLSDMHEMAFPAAEAAEAAGLEGKFWEMHDYIYKNQKELSPDMLLNGATKLSLDMKKFQEDASSTGVNTRINNDFESGILSGVNGTPSFFVNGNKFDGDGEQLYGLIKESVSNPT